MPRLAIIALIASLGLASAAMGRAAMAEPAIRDPEVAPAGDYVLDPRHARLTAKIAYLSGFHSFVRFTRLEGGFSFDPAQVEATRMTVTVDARSLRTGLPPYDALLSGRKFFNTASHPTIVFVSTAVDRGQEGRGRILGDLTLLGVTRPVAFDVVFKGVQPGEDPAQARMGFSGAGKIRRSDFGMKAAKGLAGDEVGLDFHVEFVKK